MMGRRWRGRKRLRAGDRSNGTGEKGWGEYVEGEVAKRKLVLRQQYDIE
jgi:hypothetical protein